MSHNNVRLPPSILMLLSVKKNISLGYIQPRALYKQRGNNQSLPLIGFLLLLDRFLTTYNFSRLYIYHPRSKMAPNKNTKNSLPENEIVFSLPSSLASGGWLGEWIVSFIEVRMDLWANKQRRIGRGFIIAVPTADSLARRAYRKAGYWKLHVQGSRWGCFHWFKLLQLLLQPLVLLC